MLKWVLGPRVVVGAGAGGIHSKRGLESHWFGGHTFERGLFLKRELIYQIHRVGDRCFQYPFCFRSSDRMSARHAIALIRCACTYVPGVSKSVTGVGNTVLDLRSYKGLGIKVTMDNEV